MAPKASNPNPTAIPSNPRSKPHCLQKLPCIFLFQPHIRSRFGDKMAPERIKPISKNHASLLLAKTAANSTSSKKSKSKAKKKAKISLEAELSANTAPSSSGKSSGEKAAASAKAHTTKKTASASDIDLLFAAAKNKSKAAASDKPSKKRKRVKQAGSDEGSGSEEVEEESESGSESDGGWQEDSDEEDAPPGYSVSNCNPGDASYGLIKSNNSSGIVNPEPGVHRIDKATGLPVYKAHLLKVGEGGGTPLCPFDCNCCF